MQQAISSQEHVELLTRSMIRESQDYLKKNSGVQECCACVAKPNVATIERVTSSNSVARDSIKQLWKTVEMDPYSKVLEETTNVTSTSRGFRTMKHSVATYEQTKKGLSLFLEPCQTIAKCGKGTQRYFNQISNDAA